MQSNSRSWHAETPPPQGFSGSRAETCYPEDDNPNPGYDETVEEEEQMGESWVWPQGLECGLMFLLLAGE